MKHGKMLHPDQKAQKMVWGASMLCKKDVRPEMFLFFLRWWVLDFDVDAGANVFHLRVHNTGIALRWLHNWLHSWLHSPLRSSLHSWLHMGACIQQSKLL